MVSGKLLSPCLLRLQLAICGAGGQGWKINAQPGKQGQAGPHRHELETTGQTETAMVLFAPDLDGMGFLWQPGTFVKDLNTQAWRRMGEAEEEQVEVGQSRASCGFPPRCQQISNTCVREQAGLSSCGCATASLGRGRLVSHSVLTPAL